MAFSLLFIKLFIALSRQVPKEGIHLGSRLEGSSFAVALAQQVGGGEGLLQETPSNFLTTQTAEGLCVAILSTLELSRYLLKECNFKYVLSEKFNQDVLEVL